MTTDTDTDDSTASITDRVTASGEAAGASIGAYLAAAVWFIPSLMGGIMLGILGKMPKRTDVYRKFIRMGYRGMYKKTNAHVVTNTIYGDGAMVPRPAEVDDETGHLETKNGEWWTVENGVDPVRLYDVPVTTGVADHHELVDHVGARVAEAVDLGPSRYQTVEDTPQGVEPVDTEAGATQAATDGSGAVVPRESSTFDDIWVDASNPEKEADGWIVSMKKMYAMHFDRAGSEEMEQQETRGILAAKDPKSDTKQAILFVLVGLGGVALGLFGPALASSIAGGGGAGSPVPITISVLGALL